MEKQIKVMKIISPYQVVLNCGLEDNITHGTKFLIYGLDDLIIDIDTGKPLEELELVRGRGRVIHIQNKICTIESNSFEETPKTITKKQQNFTPSLSFSFPATEETEITRKRLPFDDVQIGDLARKIK